MSPSLLTSPPNEQQDMVVFLVNKDFLEKKHNM